MARILRNDMVEVISGNDRGKRGRVLRVIPDKDRVIVQGINMRWKHLRKSQQNPKGGRLKREVAVHVSNVMLFDEEAGVRTRVGRIEKDGKRVRIARKTGKEIGGGSTASAKPAKKKAGKAKKGEE